MNTMWKNSLQEYCQKQKIALPNYRVKNQSGPGHILKFQVEVEVNGQWYVGDALCPSKKEAEQSAAKRAWATLAPGNEHTPSSEPATLPTSEPDLHEPPSYLEAISADSKYHLPRKYADIEAFISTKVGSAGGRIRKIVPLDSPGQYKFEISGSYRYCENVQRHHQKNQIYFIVDPIKKTYTQKCHDSQCYGFQSARKYIDDDDEKSNFSTNKCLNCSNTVKHQNQSECERCGLIFCRKCLYECDLCHDALHCNRCFDLCFDCHDS